LRRSLCAGLITLGLTLGFGHAAFADPAHDYAGSRTPAWARQPTPSESVSAARHKIVGPDVSNWQGCSLDWSRIASRRDFAFIKASEGTDFTDQCFAYNWQSSHAVHLPRGAYDFARPHADLSTAQAEADHYIAVVKSAGGFHKALPPVLDVEANDDSIDQGQMRAWIRTWVQWVRHHTKRRTITIYTGNWFWEPNVGSWRPKHALLWESCYCSSWQVAPVVGWGAPNWWQYTDGTSGPTPRNTPGIGPSDSSFWLGHKSALLALRQNG